MFTCWGLLTGFCCKEPVATCCSEFNELPCPKSTVEPDCTVFIMCGWELEIVDTPDKELCCKLVILFCCIAAMEPCTGCIGGLPWPSRDCGCWSCMEGWGSCPCNGGVGLRGLLELRKKLMCFSIWSRFSLWEGWISCLLSRKNNTTRSSVILNTLSFSICSVWGRWGRESCLKSEKKSVSHSHASCPLLTFNSSASKKCWLKCF